MENQGILIWLLIVLGQFLIAVAERRRHLANTGRLLLAGAEEGARWPARLWAFASPLVLACAFAEWIFVEKVLGRSLILVCVALIVVGTGLRLWSMNALGPWWSQRCIVLPGGERVRVGPYKYLNHPEFLGRLLETGGLCLLLGSWWSLAFWLFVCAATVMTLLRTESELLETLTLEAQPETTRESQEPLAQGGNVD
jgi:methyltransferase